MPKKFATNSKSAEARAREHERKTDERVRKEKEKEDAQWEEQDRKVIRKQQAKEEEDAKRAEQLLKAAEKRRLREEEEAALGGKMVMQKLTRAQVEQNIAEGAPQRARPGDVVEQKFDDINPNRADREFDEATGLDEAIAASAVLSDDRHPEKRLAAAHRAFEQRTLLTLKIQNPGLKHSQLKEMCWRLWQKSPENPLNQVQAQAPEGR
eukprot:TRINITY_DN44757_c0_g1_i1.p1 TRINITY_DN44757_c0_g1~~TRINITY_DN44757_c0_g1_i1.p1  ORF type:complete len:209 (-),score=66.15 TRINITY_DN44757_c0_g1_i1:69-695(-)